MIWKIADFSWFCTVITISSCDVPMMKKHSYRSENVKLTPFCDVNKFSIGLMNYFQNCWKFIKLMTKIHQIIVEISSNQKNFKIHLMKTLQIDDENSSFVWWIYFNFYSQKEKRRDQEENLGPFVPESDILP